MDQNDPKTGLTGRQLKAAVLCAEDALSDEKIAEACGVSRSSLDLTGTLTATVNLVGVAPEDV
jgi:hypothetical protein